MTTLGGGRTLALAEPLLGGLMGGLNGLLGLVQQPFIVPNWRSSRESMALERTLTGHEDCVRAVAIMPNGRRALSASDDRTLKLWNLETGELLASVHLEAALGCVAAVMLQGEDIGRFTVVVGDAAGNVYCLAVVDPTTAD